MTARTRADLLANSFQEGQFRGIGSDDVRDLCDSVLFLSDIASLPDYANDTAAASGGVAVGAPYRNGSFLMVRVT